MPVLILYFETLHILPLLASVHETSHDHTAHVNPD